MTPAPNFRAWCAELVNAFDIPSSLQYKALALARARAALATPPPEPPTDEELNALWNCCGNHDEDGDHYGNIFQFARAAIKRWGAK